MNYRVLVLRNDGVVETFHDIVAYDDSEAAAIARTGPPGTRPFELWKGSTLIRTVRPSASL